MRNNCLQMLMGGGKHLLTKVSDRLSAEGGWYDKIDDGTKKVDRNTLLLLHFVWIIER